MVISVFTREDAVIVDPEKFMAAARDVRREHCPDITDDELTAQIANIYDAMDELLTEYGSIASDHPWVADGGTEPERMHGGYGLLPGQRVRGRRDGLSPAGRLTIFVAADERPLQDNGCFVFESTPELFAGPIRRAEERGDGITEFTPESED